jgi:hypothetical protein
MLMATWAPPFAGAPVPVIPGYTAEGRQHYFRGTAEVGQYRFELPDDPRNRRTLGALPPAFVVAEFAVDPREAVRAQLRELGIPHRKNERLDTLLRKLPHDAPGHRQLD